MLGFWFEGWMFVFHALPRQDRSGAHEGTFLRFQVQHSYIATTCCGTKCDRRTQHVIFSATCDVPSFGMAQAHKYKIGDSVEYWSSLARGVHTKWWQTA
jgi:hypothetical protein